MTETRLVIGCGYLGERVARQWVEQGFRVVAVTRSPDRADILRTRGVEPFVADVTRPASLAGLPEAGSVLYAVGFDATAGVTRREVYVDGFRNALSALQGRADRILYISSTSVYGQTDGSWVDERSPCVPTRENGRICLEAEELLRGRGASTSAGRPVGIVLRLGGIYGPGRLLTKVERLRAGDALPGNPDGWLNLIHVDDAARAVLAAENQGRPSETYLIVDDRPVRRAEYYGLLASLVGAPAPRFDGTESPRSPGLNKRCCNRRMRTELGVELEYPTVETGLPASLSSP